MCSYTMADESYDVIEEDEDEVLYNVAVASCVIGLSIVASCSVVIPSHP